MTEELVLICGRLEEMSKIALDAMNQGDPLAVTRPGGAGSNAIEALALLGRWAGADALNDAMVGRACVGCTVGAVTPR